MSIMSITIACRIPNKQWLLTTVKRLQRKIDDTGMVSREINLALCDPLTLTFDLIFIGRQRLEIILVPNLVILVSAFLVLSYGQRDYT